MWWVRLAVLTLMYAVTVLARFHVHVEPGQLMWFLWVGAQGACAASLGYIFAQGRNR